MERSIKIEVPENKELEQEVLSCILYEEDRAAQAELAGKLDLDCFADDNNRDLFKHLAGWIKARGDNPNYKLTTYYTTTGQKYPKRYIENLPAPAYNHSELEDMINQLATYAKQRKFQMQIVGLVKKPQNLTPQATVMIENKAHEVNQRYTPAEMQEGSHVFFERIKENYENQGRTDLRISTGFNDYDNILCGGYTPKTLNIIAARPSVGKTTFALNIALNVAMRDITKPVLVFSAEMSNEELADDFISRFAHIPVGGMTDKAYHASLTSQELKRALERVRPVNNIPKLLLKDKIPTVEVVINTARKIAREYSGLSLLVLDYIQLLTSEAHFENRALEVAAMSRSLTLLAQELACPVLLISQLNRNIEDKGRKGTPQNSDLRDSGSLEQDASTITFLTRDLMKGNQEATLHITKNRKGKTGKINLLFVGEYKAFFDAGQPVPEYESDM